MSILTSMEEVISFSSLLVARPHVFILCVPQEPDTEVLVSMLISLEEVIGVAGPKLLSQERLGQALGALQVPHCSVSRTPS